MVSLQETFLCKGKKWTRLVEHHYECWVVGVDLGQRNDHTVVCAIQHSRIPLDDWVVDEHKANLQQKIEERFAVRGLQRLPLGMDYTLQGSRIRQLMLSPPICNQAALVIDDAGVGAPVCDQVIAYGQLHPVRATLTGTGTQVNQLGYRRYSVPKLLLVSNLDARLNTGELVFADDLAEREVIKDELVNFQRHVTAAGRATFEARANKHDDIVLSVGFALWWSLERRRREVHIGHLRGLY